jgi:phosphatidylglycerol lysyltransferase
LAYRVGRGLAVVLGDPVGPEEVIEGIVRDFTRFCDDNGWGVAFHQVMPDHLDVYEHFGFKKLKVGDEAIVDLTQFTLEGKAAKTFRSKVNQLEKEGVHTRYYEPPIPPGLMSQIRVVSDEWLLIPGRRERQFTLGMFDEEYLNSTPLFTAEDVGGRVLAFVNLVPSYRPGEASIDLMRRRTEGPNGIMDYVFIKLFLRSKEQGLERFDLGMAPMAGFKEQEEATPEERAIHAFFQHLSFLFSFKGLLAYKAKFAATWEPRYLIYRNILDLPRVAMAISAVSEVDDD